MRTITLLVVLMTAWPAAAQSRLYTNADLTPTPMTAWTRTVTPAELEALAAHQFHAPAPALGPTVIVVGRSAPQLRSGTTEAWINRPPAYLHDMWLFNVVALEAARYTRGGRYLHRHSRIDGAVPEILRDASRPALPRVRPVR